MSTRKYPKNNSGTIRIAIGMLITAAIWTALYYAIIAPIISDRDSFVIGVFFAVICTVVLIVVLYISMKIQISL